MPKILKGDYKVKKKSGVFAGCYISEGESDFLSLVCVADNVTKTDVIRSMFAEWYEKTHSEENEKAKINTVAKKAYMIFIENGKKKYAGKKSRNFDLFCEALKEELAKKGILEETLDAIIARTTLIHKKYEEKNKQK